MDDFVKTKRANFNPSATSVLCSTHFLPEDYNQRFDFVSKNRPQLVKDEVGTVAIPRIYVCNHEEQTCKLSDRDRRKALKDAIASVSSTIEVELPVREVVEQQQ
ncbi:uncharacterized protein LOC116291923 [Actinia tenebrosa]|uniref:Uncharacterized protein LOC116291923 n=1 Tax=Actinia tenebrosa TaxID=6105 RepID=A0A6P8HQT4_ACTTE|nr:uncharacterized protein LOC116291923 [Actinia tenebrosa]